MNYTNEQLEELWSNIDPRIKHRLLLIAAECDRACNLHPVFPQDKIHQAGIVCEEAGELIQAAIDLQYHKGSIMAIETEVLHTAATALRMLIHLPDASKINPFNCFGRRPHPMDFTDYPEYCLRLQKWNLWEKENNPTEEKWIKEMDTQQL